jgi:ribosomal protein S18 acetylase RimI-like enzyme
LLDAAAAELENVELTIEHRRMQIQRVTEVDAELVAAFARLIPQLTSAPPPDADDLAAVIAQPGASVLVAREGNAIVGLTCLTIYRIFTGLQARIDDVVVDTARRGRGIGEALTREAMRIARTAGARTLHLTSHPSREAANRLYARLGFVRRETNVYKLQMP